MKLSRKLTRSEEPSSSLTGLGSKIFRNFSYDNLWLYLIYILMVFEWFYLVLDNDVFTKNQSMISVGIPIITSQLFVFIMFLVFVNFILAASVFYFPNEISPNSILLFLFGIIRGVIKNWKLVISYAISYASFLVAFYVIVEMIRVNFYLPALFFLYNPLIAFVMILFTIPWLIISPFLLVYLLPYFCAKRGHFYSLVQREGISTH